MGVERETFGWRGRSRNANTNTVEGFWGLLNMGVNGISTTSAVVTCRAAALVFVGSGRLVPARSAGDRVLCFRVIRVIREIRVPC